MRRPSPASQRLPAIGLLAVLNGLLAWNAWSLLIRPVPLYETTPSNVVLGEAEDNLSGIPERLTPSEILARPLFSSTRRPYEEPLIEASAVEAPVGEVQAPPLSYSLAGTHIEAQKRLALLYDSTDQSSLWLAEGGSVGGWRLVSVRADSVILEAGDDRATLDLYPLSHP